MSDQSEKVFMADLIALGQKESELSKAMLDIRARLHSLRHFEAPKKNTINYDSWPSYNMWSYQDDVNKFGEYYKDKFTIGFCQHAKDYGDIANICITLAESIKEACDKDSLDTDDMAEVEDFWKELGNQLADGKKSCDDLTASILIAQGEIGDLLESAKKVKTSHKEIIASLVRDEYSKEIREGKDPEQIIKDKTESVNKKIKKLESKLDDLRKARDWTFGVAGGSTILVVTIPFSPLLALAGSGIALAIDDYKGNLKELYSEHDKLGNLEKTSGFLNSLDKLINQANNDLKTLSEDIALIRSSFENISKNFSTSGKLNKLIFDTKQQLRVTFIDKIISKLKEIEKTADEYVEIADKMDFILIDSYDDLVNIAA
ncbi:hypothetical protein [Marinomonas spartinae]|uniref:hypothetical protein n=1 Tax=Marinomonas spartinae TaxID=1792290 RepID=UPI0018F11673|nr:hypothetical protein [Marinomonas spartinae]MBJ7555142.1 hypothetical protein [Marinomonas spartinae]